MCDSFKSLFQLEAQIAFQVCCPGILVYLFLWLLSCKLLLGADYVNPLAQWFTWEMAPCQVGTGPVKLAGLSSKSDSTFVDDKSSGYTFG